jgi:Flp pilus assembly pilin Flp
MALPSEFRPDYKPYPMVQSDTNRVQLDSEDRYMCSLISRLWFEDDGQDIAEYAVMLAVILVLVVGTIRLVGSNANNAFSSVASSIH